MRITVKVSPGAKKSELLGWEEDYPLIGRVLRLRIDAAAVDNKANKRLVLVLAKLLQLPKHEVRIVSGTSSRIKVLEIPDSAAAKLAELC